MRIISKKALREHWERRPDSQKELAAWYSEVRQAQWRLPTHVKEKYGNSSILRNNRVVFNICGNKYRLIVQINYSVGITYVRFIGTHKEYDNINAETI